MSLASRSLQKLGGMLLLLTTLMVCTAPAHAVPAFARQTGFQCAMCHVAFPELTPTGRLFKLKGYTLGTKQDIPLAVMLLASANSISKNSQDDGSKFKKEGNLVFEGGSAFLAGKFSEHTGGFVQWTYDNLGDSDEKGFVGHSEIDNVDLRYANELDFRQNNLLYGFTLHNAPTVQDVWNTIPAWSFPYQSPKIATNGSGPASTFIESEPRVAGFGAYGMLNGTLYGEFSLYHTADGILSALRAGTHHDPAESIALQGYNPYWRLNLTQTWGAHTASVGYYGMQARQFPDSTQANGATDRFIDHGIDAQYQYLAEPHTVSAQLNFIRERADWRASFANGGVDNPSSVLRSFKAKASYYYQRKYGATIGYFSSAGDVDCARFCLKDEEGAPVVDANGQVVGGKPDTRGFIYEVSYTPIQNFRLSAQYTAFTKFNGVKNNYNAAGRNAKDNNTLYLYGWLAF
jgi:hypothetical protein